MSLENFLFGTAVVLSFGFIGYNIYKINHPGDHDINYYCAHCIKRKISNLKLNHPLPEVKINHLESHPVDNIITNAYDTINHVTITYSTEILAVAFNITT